MFKLFVIGALLGLIASYVPDVDAGCGRGFFRRGAERRVFSGNFIWNLRAR